MVAVDWVGTLGIATLVGIFLALATIAGSLAAIRTLLDEEARQRKHERGSRVDFPPPV
jgi:hypothetical protein